MLDKPKKITCLGVCQDCEEIFEKIKRLEIQINSLYEYLLKFGESYGQRNQNSKKIHLQKNGQTDLSGQKKRQKMRRIQEKK